MKASRSVLSLSFKHRIADQESILGKLLPRLVVGMAVAWPAIAWAQSTNFPTVQKTVKAPKGIKLKGGLGLREIKPQKRSILKKTPTTAQVEEPKPEESPHLRELEALLVGAWSLISTVDRPLSTDLIDTAARRCFRQMPLKNIVFDPSAAKQIPDINSLFGDLVYYQTDDGLQRLDINKGLVLLLPNVKKTRFDASKTVWEVSGERLRFRIRFSKLPSPSAKTRIMIEEAGIYLKCPLPEKEDASRKE